VQKWLENLMVFVATGAGAGRIPWMPGTVGALWGLPLSWSVIHAIPSPLARAALLVGLALIGVPICAAAARQLGGHDPGSVVWDEIVSMPWVFWSMTPSQMNRWDILLFGFLLHRLFDIAKPFPLRRLEGFPGGWGIMADDLGAAVYAAIALPLLLRALNWIS
jgi:phosphatidylglycerophosphatase A